MQNNKYIISIIGDSIPFEYCNKLENYLNKHNNNYNYHVKNECEAGITSVGLVNKIQNLDIEKANCILIHIGMNDWRQKISLADFKQSIKRIVEHCLDKKMRRTIIGSITPDFNGIQFNLSQSYSGTSEIIKEYNYILKQICKSYKIRYIDLYNAWLKEYPNVYQGLKDAIHPNAIGQSIVLRVLNYFIPRENLTIVWPFNGKYANCNYKCPYCYVPSSVNTDNDMQHSISEWKDVFENSFGKHQHITLYLSYGEPTVVKQFIELLEMVGENPNWEVMVTSNLSTDFKRISRLKIVQDSRMNINASFHPTETSINNFLDKLDYLRSIGIECPVVYTMYPGKNLKMFESYFERFRKNNYLVHIRRFRGYYQKKKFPEAYTHDEVKRFIKYMDKASISYMLTNKSSLNHLTFLGVHHIQVDTDGTVELCDEYPGDRDLGNVFDGTADLYDLPQPFPGPVSLGSVDDVANMIELEYDELRGNHVTSFSKQGGVYKTKNGTPVYAYEDFNFDNEESVEKEFYKYNEMKSEFDSRLFWFLKHRILYYSLERNYIRAKQFLKGKLWLLKHGKLSIRDSLSFHS
ncbi:MAG: GDSL-type esterase/lipase family protein [Thermodesulfobacteriota bacterium]